MNSYDEFLGRLIKVEILQKAKERSLADWGFDVPITLLFADIGRCISEQFDELSAKERVAIFQLLEEGMDDKNIELKTLISTGLLEALYGHAGKDALLWDRINSELGALSKKYLTDWAEWAGD